MPPAEASTKNRVAIHAYVLMTNHVHLLVSPGAAESCGKMMQSLGRRYVRRINDRYKRSGTLWEGRYKSTLVDSDTYFFTVCRYIEMNPVRAGIVDAPEDYPWSSYTANALGEHNSLLTPHKLYLGLGREPRERQHNYATQFDRQPSPGTLQRLRNATNKGWAFGSDDFMANLQAIANRAPASSGWGVDRKSGRKAKG